MFTKIAAAAVAVLVVGSAAGMTAAEAKTSGKSGVTTQASAVQAPAARRTDAFASQTSPTFTMAEMRAFDRSTKNISFY